MKKTAFVLLGAALLLALTCCSAHSADSSAGAKNRLIKVGFSQTGAESVWRVTNTSSVKNALSEHNGYELIFDDGQQKQENQIKAIRGFIQQDVDYIVLAPIVESGWDSVLEEAKAAGIPVIIEDRMVRVGQSDLYAAYVGSNFRREGDTAVNWLASLLKAQGRAGSAVHIADIEGTVGSSAQIGRTAALDAALKAHPNWVLTARRGGDFIKPKAYEEMKDVLTRTHDIDAVYCDNDSEASGAIQALQEAGLTCRANGGIIVISFDATSEGLTDCLNGTISLDMECNPLDGPYVAQIIQNLRQKKRVDKITYTNETSFDCFTITPDIIKKRAY